MSEFIWSTAPISSLARGNGAQEERALDLLSLARSTMPSSLLEVYCAFHHLTIELLGCLRTRLMNSRRKPQLAKSSAEHLAAFLPPDAKKGRLRRRP